MAVLHGDPDVALLAAIENGAIQNHPAPDTPLFYIRVWWAGRPEFEFRAGTVLGFWVEELAQRLGLELTAQVSGRGWARTTG